MNKEIDIFSLLPEEAHKPIDTLGYDFLKSQGYNVSGVSKSYKCRSRLKREMKKRGEELRYCAAFDREQNAILIWFELYEGEKCKARSTGLKFLPREGRKQ